MLSIHVSHGREQHTSEHLPSSQRLDFQNPPALRMPQRLPSLKHPSPLAHELVDELLASHKISQPWRQPAQTLAAMEARRVMTDQHIAVIKKILSGLILCAGGHKAPSSSTTLLLTCGSRSMSPGLCSNFFVHNVTRRRHSSLPNTNACKSTSTQVGFEQITEWKSHFQETVHNNIGRTAHTHTRTHTSSCPSIP
jgi:hypothetical protein